MVKKRTIEEINKRIKSGKAIVMTADELAKLLDEGDKIKMEDVDVVTSATCGLMSGTAAILSFPITKRGKFTRAKEVLLNGIPAYPGPCPNERLGVLDLIIYGTNHSIYDDNYGGGHLFKDLARGNNFQVEMISKEGKRFKKEISKKEINYARLLGIRNCFKNYIGMINRTKKSIPSIFHVRPLGGPYKELSVCGCGALNPLTKDPKLNVIGVGTKVLINDAVGYITGLGTRASIEKPNLSGYANLLKMDPYYMGGFVTAEGPEVISSWAVPIPILNSEIFKNVCLMDAQEPLPIADISNRIPIITSDYGKVWQGTDLTVKFNPKECINNHKICISKGLMKEGKCPVEQICPVHAFTTKGAKLDRKLCFNCGACVQACKVGCFKMNMGEVEIDDHTVPITLRQSDRARAIKLAKRLKNRIIKDEFTIVGKVENLF